MSEERGTRVYVGNLTDKIKKEHLEEEFTKYGKLNSVWGKLQNTNIYNCNIII